MRFGTWTKALLALGLLAAPGLALGDDDKAEDKGSEKAEIAWAKSYSDALAAARKSGKPIMIDVYTDWCGWCKKLDEDTYSAESVAEKARQFVPVKINAEKEGEEMAVAQAYGITGFPTILFLDPNDAFDPATAKKGDTKGEGADKEKKDAATGMVGKIVGYMPAGPFGEKLDSIAKSYKEFPSLVEKYRKDPGDVAFAKEMIVAYQLRGDGKNAEAILKDLEERGVKDDLSSAYNAVGDSYQEKGDFKAAIPYFKKAADLAKSDKDKAYARMSMAICYASMGQFGESVPLLEDVAKLDGDDVKEEKAQAENLLAQVRRIMKLQELEKAQKKGEEDK
jgi:thioredoxin-like negative regulator of GroEL